MLPFELTKDTPYYEYFNRNWPCYKGFLLYSEKLKRLTEGQSTGIEQSMTKTEYQYQGSNNETESIEFEGNSTRNLFANV